MKYILLLCFALTVLTAAGQFELKGRVTAAGTKGPLAGASVFLSNTSIGTVSNAAGEFTLFVPAGKYDLIASFVGYETHAQTISTALNNVLVIELQPKAEVFDEVIVSGYEKDGWKKWGQFFIENFIGTSEWAADCRIKNYDVIKFRNSKKENKLYAVATDQLVIVNNALGYTVKYQLEDFEYDFKSGLLLYLGYPLFTQMNGGKSKLNRWNRRRQDVYYGSMMEFMRALYRNRIEEEGFEVRRLVKTRNEEKIRVKQIYKKHALSNNTAGFYDSTAYYNNVLEQPDEFSTYSKYTIPGDSIAYQIDSVTAGLTFDNYLHIIYTKAAPPDSYRKLSPNNARMMSQLTYVQPEPVHIQSNGNYSPPTNLVSLGYWSWSEKMANMLPFDYKPPLRK